MTQNTREDPYFDDLAACALGALDPDERRTVEAHIDSCPACTAELEELQDASAALALYVPAAAPPARVKARLMARIGQERALAGNPERDTETLRWSRLLLALMRRSSRMIPGPRLAYMVGTAVVVGAAALSAGLLLASNRLHQRVGELESMVATEATVVTEFVREAPDRPVPVASGQATPGEPAAQQAAGEGSSAIETVSRLATANEQLQKMIRDQMALTRLRSIPTTRTTFFEGMGTADDALAALVTGFKSEATGILMVYGLRPPPPGYVYQLWLIYDGERRSVGTFTVDSMGYAWLNVPLPEGGIEYLSGGVTLEPLGGSREPTGIKVLDISNR